MHLLPLLSLYLSSSPFLRSRHPSAGFPLLRPHPSSASSGVLSGPLCQTHRALDLLLPFPTSPPPAWPGREPAPRVRVRVRWLRQGPASRWSSASCGALGGGPQGRGPRRGGHAPLRPQSQNLTMQLGCWLPGRVAPRILAAVIAPQPSRCHCFRPCGSRCRPGLGALCLFIRHFASSPPFSFAFPSPFCFPSVSATPLWPQKRSCKR